MNKIVILAAGKGTRMDSELPKVLMPFNGRPMITYLLDSVRLSGIDSAPILVVSPDNISIIKNYLSEYECLYAFQDRQLGTGHAVKCTEPFLQGADNVAVLYGDHPLIQKETLQHLIETHTSGNAQITLMTLKIDNFSDWRKIFLMWGRIVRHNNKIQKIVEYKDATAEQREITEVNPSLYCFKKNWLFNNIKTLTNNNQSGEYYLTDMVKIACDQGCNIADIQISPEETIGVNTKEELMIAEQIFKKLNK